MGFTNYISESEAMQVCGVSAKTLSRFAEAGYLSIEKESDGLRMYSANELERVFGGLTNSRLRRKPEVLANPATDSASQMAWSAQEATESGISEKEAFAQKTENVSAGALQEEDSGAEELPTSTASSDSNTLKNTQEGTPGLPHPPTSQSESPELLELQRRLAHLERVQEVNEKIIELREEQIQELTKERDWLRTRVERLEEKAERDQLLLLSETQIVRQMLDHQQRAASPVRAALEWIGILEPRRPHKFTKEDVLISGPNKS